MHSSCPRCGGFLQSIEGEPPVFCPHCGLPQLRISADTVETGSSATPGTGDGPPSATGLDWARALRLLLVAALAGVILPSLLPDALTGGLVGGMALLMTPVLTLVVIFIYGRRGPLPSGAGARMGAVLGLLMGSLIALLTGIAGFVLRYHFHSHAMDDKIQQALAQMPAQISAAGPPPPGLLAFLQTPEFRAGTFILGHAVSMLFLVGVGALCGSVAAAILRQRPRPEE